MVSRDAPVNNLINTFGLSITRKLRKMARAIQFEMIPEFNAKAQRRRDAKKKNNFPLCPGLKLIA
jgi:hypothetical protein